MNCVLCAVFAIKHGLELRKVGIALFVYAILITVPILMYGITELTFRQYVGYAIRILTGCFIASYFRHDFISKYENLVFALTYISIPLFTLQLINPNIYDIFTPLTRAIIGTNIYKDGYGVTHVFQYMIVYFKHELAYRRNSGFMWEPGAFAMMLTWAMLFLMYLTRFRWHRRMIVYGIAMLTTFSLMGYPSMVLLILLFLAQNSDWKKFGYTIVGGGLLVLLLMQTPIFQGQSEMMINKAENYIYNSEAQLKTNTYVMRKKSSKRVGRIAQFYILSDIIRDNPFGQGMEKFKYDSANGLIDLIVKWGVNAIIVLAISFYFFSKRLEQMAHIETHWYIILFTMIVLVMPALSNPVFNRVFFLTLIVFPLFSKRQI